MLLFMTTSKLDDGNERERASPHSSSCVAPDASARAEVLFQAMTGQPGVRLPGDRRFALRKKAAADGVEVPDALLAEIERRAA